MVSSLATEETRCIGKNHAGCDMHSYNWCGPYRIGQNFEPKDKQKVAIVMEQCLGHRSLTIHEAIQICHGCLFRFCSWTEESLICCLDTVLRFCCGARRQSYCLICTCEFELTFTKPPRHEHDLTCYSCFFLGMKQLFGRVCCGRGTCICKITNGPLADLWFTTSSREADWTDWTASEDGPGRSNYFLKVMVSAIAEIQDRDEIWSQIRWLLRKRVWKDKRLISMNHQVQLEVPGRFCSSPEHIFEYHTMQIQYSFLFPTCQVRVVRFYQSACPPHSIPPPPPRPPPRH